MLKKIIAICLGGCFQLAFSTQVMCPGKMQFVNIGDSLQTVLSACGKPQKIIEKKASQQNNPSDYIVWFFQLSNRGKASLHADTLVTIFSQTSVAAIRINNSLANQYQCPNGIIQIGSSMEDVVANCGPPIRQKKVANPKASAKSAPANQALLVYQPESYMPARTFIFNKDKLVGVEQSATN